MPHINEPETYRTIADADDYFANQLYATDWTGATDADKAIALLQATRAIDSLRYDGLKFPVAEALEADSAATEATLIAADATQYKEWPRVTSTTDGAWVAGTLDDQEWVLTIDATSGNFTLTLNDEVTGSIAYDALAATILAALEALTSVTAGDLTVAVDAGGTDGVGPYVVTHTTDQNNTLVAASVDLAGSGATVKAIVHADNVPDVIFYAVCEEAMSLLSGRLPNEEYRCLSLTSDGIGSNRVNVDRSGQSPLHTANYITSPTAWKYLSRHLATRNSFTITRVN
jgi:hypothetical protein